MARRIRVAMAADAGQIQAIYAPIVRDTMISFEDEPPTAEEMAGRIAGTLSTHPYLVCEEDGRVLGYIYASVLGRAACSRWGAPSPAFPSPYQVTRLRIVDDSWMIASISSASAAKASGSAVGGPSERGRRHQPTSRHCPCLKPTSW